MSSREVMGRAMDEPRRRSDGEQTHATILETAMRLASIEGLSSLTIGRLAQEVGVSRSGVFAHFRSKQRLQQETIAAAQEVFEREVLGPGLDAPEGLAQLEGFCEAYLSYVERGVFPGGCFFAQLLAEFDGPDGPIHDEVATFQQGGVALLEGLITTAQQQGELDAGVDPGQLAFELYAALELANYFSTLHRDPAIVDRGRTAVQATIANARPAASTPQADATGPTNTV
ncbi:TetR/AcrR family transcriptional regulator [Egibacter rhizosphaerae]|uniref:TetR/AcrR family transcriptional regulator n=1 Tax=Egibacter rhizosphaerae TaxID=1670831 RepID=A0A411YG18_9ACTN|nr:TetR/AcrR family transcriptional regulator [Egibacter rhizosphaerae]QBI20119.1 TetR/AcrR family transcriptional regulator [Egibacter rhizosphaerae]